MKVTRTLLANVPDGLDDICKAMGFVRADIWRRFGALGCVGKNADVIRKTITAANLYGSLRSLPVDGTIRAETAKDVVNDILTYKAAARVKVRQSVAARTKGNAERKSLYTLLKKDQWLTQRQLPSPPSAQALSPWRVAHRKSVYRPIRQAQQ